MGSNPDLAMHAVCVITYEGSLASLPYCAYKVDVNSNVSTFSYVRARGGDFYF